MKPSLVFICPVMPSFGGGGLRMRAAQNLKALASQFEVYLLVISIYGGGEGEPAPEILGLCREWHRVTARDPHVDNRWTTAWRHLLRWGMSEVPPEWNSWESRKAVQVEKFLEKIKPDRIWVFRLYLLPWIWKWTQGGQGVWLDLDECESRSRARQADLLRKNGEFHEAENLKKTALVYDKIERLWLARLDKVVVASPVEAELLRKRVYEKQVVVWPNIISPVSDGPVAEGGLPGKSGYRLFFVGSMGHFPNRDAVAYAASEIIPRLSVLTGKTVTLLVAGAGSESRRKEIECPSVECLGEVVDLAAVYAGCDLVLVPLRAGSGSRIKILEAFAYGCAVVSTTVGAEGLEVRNGNELLMADDPEALALCCAEILKDESRRKQLALAGTAYLKGRHDFSVLEKLAATLALKGS